MIYFSVPIFLLKPPLEFLDLSLYEVPEKTSFQLRKFCTAHLQKPRP